MAAEPLESLTLLDYDDRELLKIVLDEIDEKTGYARTKDIAKTIGIQGKHPNLSVGSRLAYLRSIDAVTYRNPGSGSQMWAVTQIGMDMINGKMTAAQQHAIDDAKPGQKLLLAGRLATSAHGAPFTEMKLMKRKFRREMP